MRLDDVRITGSVVKGDRPLPSSSAANLTGYTFMAVQTAITTEQRVKIAQDVTGELMDALLNTYLADSFPMDRLEAQIIQTVFTFTTNAVPLKGALDA